MSGGRAPREASTAASRCARSAAGSSVGGCGTTVNQIPAYATPGDATTGALDANREGSWRRNQLRLQAGVNVPDKASCI